MSSTIQLETSSVPPILRTERYVVTEIVINDKGQPTKPPRSVVTGKLHDCWKYTPDALVTIEKAVAFANEKGYDFVGYNLAGGSVLCVDLDNCFQSNGELKLWARVFVDTWKDFIFYAERSPGVTHHGLHLWIRADQKDLAAFSERMAAAGKKKVVKNVGADHEKIELFWSNYVTMTGNVWGEFDGGMLDNNGLEKLYTSVAGKDQAVTEVTGKRSKSAYSDLTLADMIAKPESDFPDPSSAVQSLLVKSALKNSCNHEKMEADLKQSKLYTEGKWGPNGENKWNRRAQIELDEAIKLAQAVSRNTESICELDEVNGEDVERDVLNYVWDPVVPQGKLTHWNGPQGGGKTPVVVDFLARITLGREFPNGASNGFGGSRHVILCNIEDDPGDTTMPRFDIAGGLPFLLTLIKGVKISKHDSFQKGLMTLDRHIHLVTKRAREIEGLGGIVFDPITNYLGKIKMNHEEEVRTVLTPLAQLAEELNIFVLTVGHNNRRTESTDPLNRIMGSAAFSGVARSVWSFANDDDVDSPYAHVMSPTRGKVGANSIKFHTEEIPAWIGAEQKETKVIRVVWDGTSKQTSEEGFSPTSRKDKNKTKQAGHALNNFLKSGKRAATECISFLEGEFDMKKLDHGRVRQVAGADSVQANRKWWWFLPAHTELFDPTPGPREEN